MENLVGISKRYNTQHPACCPVHGCKYSNPLCPFIRGNVINTRCVKCRENSVQQPVSLAGEQNTEDAASVQVFTDDNTGQLASAYVYLNKGDVKNTKEVLPDRVYADYDELNNLLGIEIIC